MSMPTQMALVAEMRAALPRYRHDEWQRWRGRYLRRRQRARLLLEMMFTALMRYTHYAHAGHRLMIAPLLPCYRVKDVAKYAPG